MYFIQQEYPKHENWLIKRYNFINVIPDSEGILLAWVTDDFIIGPVEFVDGWLFIKRAPLWFNVDAYI